MWEYSENLQWLISISTVTNFKFQENVLDPSILVISTRGFEHRTGQYPRGIKAQQHKIVDLRIHEAFAQLLGLVQNHGFSFLVLDQCNSILVLIPFSTLSIKLNYLEYLY